MCTCTLRNELVSKLPTHSDDDTSSTTGTQLYDNIDILRYLAIIICVQIKHTFYYFGHFQTTYFKLRLIIKQIFLLKIGKEKVDSLIKRKFYIIWSKEIF